MIVGLLTSLGGGVRQLGGLALVIARTMRALARLDRSELVRSLVGFGYESLPLGILVSAFTGGILVLLADLNVQRYGARAIVGWAAGYTVLREFGPLFVALVMTGRVGARNAAELASLSIGGQLEGLRGVGVDPFALLVAPRVAAGALGVGLLGAVCSCTAVLFAAVFSQLSIDVDLGLFFRSFAALLGWRIFVAALVKSLAFGATIAIVSTRCGLSAKGGAQAVGRAAALAVVSSSAILTGLDWLLTLALVKVLG